MTETTPAAVTDGTVAIRRDDAAMLLTVCYLYAPHQHGTGKLPADIAPAAARVQGAIESADAYEPTDAAPPVAAALDRSQVSAITEDALRAVLYAHGLMEKEVLDVLAELGVKPGSEEESPDA